MNRITSGEFQKEFGRYRTEAHKKAVIITNHGRDDLALISADEYKRLRRLDHQAFYAREVPQEVAGEHGTSAAAPKSEPLDDEKIEKIRAMLIEAEESIEKYGYSTLTTKERLDTFKVKAKARGRL